MELMKNRTLYREQVIAQRENEKDHPNSELPKTVEDIDKVNLGNVVVASQFKLFNKLLRQFEGESSQKMRKINKN